MEGQEQEQEQEQTFLLDDEDARRGIYDHDYDGVSIAQIRQAAGDDRVLAAIDQYYEMIARFGEEEYGEDDPSEDIQVERTMYEEQALASIGAELTRAFKEIVEKGVDTITKHTAVIEYEVRTGARTGARKDANQEYAIVRVKSVKRDNVEVAQTDECYEDDTVEWIIESTDSDWLGLCLHLV